MAEQKWLPLESNPDVMNKYSQVLGVPVDWEFMDVYTLDSELLEKVPKPVLAVLVLYPVTEKYVHALGVPASAEFVDVYGFDEDLLAIVPRPVIAVVLLYPITDKAEGSPIGEEDDASKLYFIKQTISNACGTIGLIHAIANNAETIGLDADKHLHEFMEKTKDMSPEEKAKHLEIDTEFGAAHEESAQEGQTQTPSRDEKVNLHFVAFIHSNGGLYELDGRKNAPVRHGDASPDNLLEETAGVVKKFMARDPEELNFTVVALVKNA